jgi:hypothetical protein
VAGVAMSASLAGRETTIRAILDDLIRQRKRIEQTRGDEGLCQANKLSIVYWQWQLSRALAEQNDGEPGA